jgi:UDP-N-acetylglucosamine 3-dehydrogenase
LEKLNIAVVGVGALGIMHVRAYAESASVGRLVICDPDEKRLAEVSVAVPGVAATYLSLEDMLMAERPDAVSVTTPDHLHRPQASICLEAGCNLLLTKPIATNLEDGRAIVHAAAGKRLMVAHEARFRPSTVAMRRLLDEEKLGEIIHVRSDAIYDKRSQFRRSPWYASIEGGRSAMVGTGIHDVDLVRFLVGRPIVSVSAVSNALGSLAFPGAKTTAALYQFEGSAIGQVSVTYEAHWPKAGSLDDRFRLIGSKGMIVGNRAAWDGQDEWHELPREKNQVDEGSRGCIRSWLESLTEGRAIAVTGEDAMASLAAAIAADVSAATGQPAVPETMDLEVWPGMSQV